jgi:ComF family protein
MLFDQHCESCAGDGYPLCSICLVRLSSSARPPDTRLRTVVIRAAFVYEGVARDVVLALKQRRSRALAMLIAKEMSSRLELEEVDMVTWAPTSRKHVRERGHDQARLLAASFSRRLGTRLHRSLLREGNRAQRGLSRRDRLDGPTFIASPFVEGKRILVIDDVITTGATLTAASECLVAAGASSVACVAVAATPEPTPIR